MCWFYDFLCRFIQYCHWRNKELLQRCQICKLDISFTIFKQRYREIRICVKWNVFQWWQVDKVSPIKLFDDNKSLAGLNLRHLLFQQGGTEYVHRAMEKVFALWSEGKVKPVVDTTWALEDVNTNVFNVYYVFYCTVIICNRLPKLCKKCTTVKTLAK